MAFKVGGIEGGLMGERVVEREEGHILYGGRFAAGEGRVWTLTTVVGYRGERDRVKKIGQDKGKRNGD
jgi:hypothetical protein